MANDENDRKDALRGGEQFHGSQGMDPWNRSDNRPAGLRGEGPEVGIIAEPMAPTRGESREPGRQIPEQGSGVEDLPPRRKQRRGFAAMDPAKQREIASKGGKASHEQGTGHEWNSEAAREAGRKGGQASRGGRGKLRLEGTGGSDESEI